MKLEVSIKFLQSTDAPEELQTTRQGVFNAGPAFCRMPPSLRLRDLIPDM